MVEPHLAEMRARMELATEPAAFALGMLTAVYFETAIEIPEEMLDRAMFVQSIKDAYSLWREVKGVEG